MQTRPGPSHAGLLHFRALDQPDLFVLRTLQKVRSGALAENRRGTQAPNMCGTHLASASVRAGVQS